MESALVNLSNDLAAIVKASETHVVSVRARRHYPASGIRWSDGVIVTADHAIQRDEDIAVTFADGKSAGATLAGRDAGTDLAILKLASSPAEAGALGRAETPRPGELALVLGRSEDSGVNASLGIISAASAEWRTWRGGQMDAYIRLDAKLFPQSTGGAVVNARGELIGMATPALSRIAGVAVPASTIKRVTQEILQKGFVPRGYFGIGVQPVPFSDQLRQKLGIANKSGLIVLTAEPNGPADKAGLLIGDIVTGADESKIEHTDDLQAFSDSGVIGKQVTIHYVRAGTRAESKLTVGERPGKRS